MSLSSVVSSVQSAANKVVGLTGKATGIISQVSSIATNTVSTVVNALPVSTGSWLSTADTILGMSSITGALEKGTSQAIAKIKELVGSSSEAISNPISFVTKTVKDTVEGIQTGADMAASAADTISGSASALGNIATRAGMTGISTASELSTAVSAIGNTVTGTIGAVTNMTAGIINVTAGTVTGLANTLAYGVNTGAAALTGTLGEVVAVTNDIMHVTNAVCGGTRAIANTLQTVGTSLLPNVLQSQVSYLSDSYLTKATQVKAVKMQDSLTTINNTLPAGSGTTESYAKVNALTTKQYSSFQDKTTGEPIQFTNNNSTLTTEAVGNVVAAAKKICPEVSVPSVSIFAKKKDLYDTTLDIATQNGMPTIVDGMLQNETYRDDRTIAVLLSNLTTVIGAGDIQMYWTIVTHIGVYRISDPKDQLRRLAANSYATAENQALFVQLLNLFGLVMADLIAGVTIGTITTTDGNKLTQLTAMDPNWAMLAMSQDEYLLAMLTTCTHTA